MSKKIKDENKERLCEKNTFLQEMVVYFACSVNCLWCCNEGWRFNNFKKIQQVTQRQHKRPVPLSKQLMIKMGKQQYLKRVSLPRRNL